MCIYRRDTHVRVRMGGIVLQCWMVVGLFSIMHHSTKATDGLPSCSDQPPPCMESQSTHQSVCSGENVTAMVGLRIPLQKIQHNVNLIGIAVYRGTKLFTEGLDSNPDLLHWSVSYLFSKADAKSGLLTVKVDVQDVQPEDEFETHIEIQLSDQLLRTSDAIWFTVDNNCSLSRNQPKGTNDIMIDDWMRKLLRGIEVTRNDSIEMRKDASDTRDNAHNISSNVLCVEREELTLVIGLTSFISVTITLLLALQVIVALGSRKSKNKSMATRAEVKNQKQKTSPQPSSEYVSVYASDSSNDCEEIRCPYRHVHHESIKIAPDYKPLVITCLNS